MGLRGDNVLITGVTGYLGNRFAKRLLKETDTHLYLFGRSKKGVPFEQRRELADLPHKERITLVEGDLHDCAPLESLAKRVDEIWHFAAITSFSERLHAQIMDTNLHGTIRLIEVAKGFTNLKCLNYISSVYGCGLVGYPAVIAEEPFAQAKRRNTYEQAKCYTEHILASTALPYRIFRPSIIVGDSETGLSDDKTVYGAATVSYIAARFLREKSDKLGSNIILDRDVINKNINIVGNTDARKNIIPINEVIDLMYGIRERSKNLNNIYHLVSNEGTSLETMNHAVNKILKFNGIKLVDHLGEDPTHLETELNELMKDYVAYMKTDDPIFDDANTMAIMPEYKRVQMTPSLVEFLFRSFFTNYAAQLAKRYSLIEKMME